VAQIAKPHVVSRVEARIGAEVAIREGSERLVDDRQ
jgi:hypothetical protein